MIIVSSTRAQAHTLTSRARLPPIVDVNSVHMLMHMCIGQLTLLLLLPLSSVGATLVVITTMIANCQANMTKFSQQPAAV